MQENQKSKISNQKSVTICCNSFPPEKGGAPTRIYNMALLLRGAGYEVSVITAMPNYPTGRIFPGYKGRFIHREVSDGITVTRLWLMPSNSGSLLRRALSLISYLLSIFIMAGPRLIFKKSDLVIVSSPPLASAWLYSWLARMGGKKVLVNVSDLWPLTAREMNSLKEGLLYRILQKAERHLYKMAAAYTGQSEEIMNHISVATGKSKPGFLYRNLQPPGKKYSLKLPEDECGPFRIIYAGNLGHAQGVLELCRAIDFTALGAVLHIYGDGAERPGMEALIAEGAGKGITLHGTVPQAQLDALLPGYNAVLVPLKAALYGAVPSKLFMAVAACIPVLFCAGGEGAKLVTAYGLGWVSAPGNYEELKERISRAASSFRDVRGSLAGKISLAGETVFSKSKQDDSFICFVKKNTL